MSTKDWYDFYVYLTYRKPRMQFWSQMKVQQLGFRITSITCFMSSRWWRASILGWGRRGSSEVWRGILYIRWFGPWDDQRTLVLWSTGLPTKKHTKNTHFPDLCTNKNVQVKFFWVNSPNTWGWGEMGFWVTWVHPSKPPGEDASTLSWQLSWRPRLQRLPSCEKTPNVLRSEVPIFEKTHGCRDRFWKVSGWVGIWGHRCFGLQKD